MLSLLQSPSTGANQTSLRDAYRQRLQEIAASTPDLSPISDRLPGVEADPPDSQFFSRISEVEEKRPAPAVGLDEFSKKIAQSLTECWSLAFTGLDHQVSLDRDRLQTALGNLDSLAGNVQSLADRLDPLSQRADLLDSNYQDLGARLIDAEQRLATSQRGIERLDAEFGQIREFCQGVEEGIRTQGETVAALSQVSERFEALTQALDAHTEAIGTLDTASSRADAAAQSLEQRLDRQAQAIQSVHGATQVQAERWGQLRDAAVGFATLLHSPVGNPPVAQEL